MSRFYELEVLSAEVRRGLRSRIFLRRLVVVLSIGFVVLLLGTIAVPTHMAKPIPYLLVGAWVAVFFGVITLLFEPCPRCGQRFSESSILNLIFFPSPTAFTSSCASCGVPLSKAG